MSSGLLSFPKLRVLVSFPQSVRVWLQAAGIFAGQSAPSTALSLLRYRVAPVLRPGVRDVCWPAVRRLALSASAKPVRDQRWLVHMLLRVASQSVQ